MSVSAGPRRGASSTVPRPSAALRVMETATGHALLVPSRGDADDRSGAGPGDGLCDGAAVARPVGCDGEHLA
ncbi:hypothetical protein [Streptomyces sp. NPDC002164]|uniref:hypothetical protein n=1 Tax=unclassified Streptomyces TaxID=2593676 RepID=UPI0036C63D79